MDTMSAFAMSSSSLASPLRTTAQGLQPRGPAANVLEAAVKAPPADIPTGSSRSSGSGGFGSAAYGFAAVLVGTLGRRVVAGRKSAQRPLRSALRISANQAVDQAESRPRLPTLSSEDLRNLKFSLPVQRQDRSGAQGTGLVVVDVDAPVEVVLECLGNFEAYPEMCRSVRQATVKSREDSTDGCFSKVAVDYTVSRFRLGVSLVHTVDKATGTVRIDLNPDARKLVLERLSGFWYVEEAPGGNAGKSRVWLSVDVQGHKLLPHAVVDAAAQTALRKATQWVKPHVERLYRQRHVKQLWKHGQQTGEPVESQDAAVGRSRLVTA
eukprot:TRINITY_DN3915_c0_g1_i1.p1 TRINITY_DN3915_c0_g1~~TRINITY_DN3915_c0_g1_i1.p1  ORF type:complete len:324 (-),score=74.85 TRINITY_DN3915_c0_g1_i1:374-1345(-)